MVVRSRKPGNYSYLKVAKALHIPQDKLIQPNGNVADFVVNDYPRGGKGYELLGVEPRGSKFVNQ